MVKRVELTIAEVNDICDAIDNSESGTEVIHNLVFGTWKKVLLYDGIVWGPDTEIKATRYAIPELQWIAINNRAIQRAKELDISAVGVVNIGLDFVNYGPSAYNAHEIYNP